jgi:LPXTG-motif cell wall-anchored protein
MYNPKPIIPVVASGTGLGISTQLPQTGSNLAIQLAVAAVAGLLAWAVLYVVQTKRANRA